MANTLPDGDHHLALLLPMEDKNSHEDLGSEVDLDEWVQVAMRRDQGLDPGRSTIWRKVEVASYHRPLRVLALRLTDLIAPVEGGHVRKPCNHLFICILICVLHQILTIFCAFFCIRITTCFMAQLRFV